MGRRPPRAGGAGRGGVGLVPRSEVLDAHVGAEQGTHLEREQQQELAGEVDERVEDGQAVGAAGRNDRGKRRDLVEAMQTSSRLREGRKTHSGSSPRAQKKSVNRSAQTRQSRT
jgi:hypothetical protein